MGGVEPSDDEKPLFVLLEDDKVVYDFAVRANRLLMPPIQGQPERDVVAVIGVHVTNSERGELATYSSGFGLVGHSSAVE
jgi:hypothetical protein